MIIVMAMSSVACQDHHYTPYDKVKEHPKIMTEQPDEPKTLAPMAPRQKAVMEQQPTIFGKLLQGKVTIGESVSGAIDPAWTLYVIARPEKGGPPLAAIKIARPKFPIDFTITEQDVMMGQPIAGMKLLVEARLDADGDAITKGPEDLMGKASGSVTLGDSGVAIKLNRQ